MLGIKPTCLSSNSISLSLALALSLSPPLSHTRTHAHAHAHTHTHTHTHAHTHTRSPSSSFSFSFLSFLPLSLFLSHAAALLPVLSFNGGATLKRCTPYGICEDDIAVTVKRIDTHEILPEGNEDPLPSSSTSMMFTMQDPLDYGRYTFQCKLVAGEDPLGGDSSGPGNPVCVLVTYLHTFLRCGVSCYIFGGLRPFLAHRHLFFEVGGVGWTVAVV
jgi:hypothetical protein